MAVTTTPYGQAPLNFAKGSVIWLTDTIKCGLVTASYTFNKDTHQFYSDITNELSTANGYTVGGVTLGSKTLTYATASDTTVLDAADAAWTVPPAQTLTCRGSFVYKSTGTASTSPLIGFVDFGTDQLTTNDVFTIAWDTVLGVCNFTT